MKKMKNLFLAMAFLSALLLGCAAVAKESNLLASTAFTQGTNFLGSAEGAKETKPVCPDCGVAFTTNERVEKYYQENFGGGFK